MRLGSGFQRRTDALPQHGSVIEKIKKEQGRTWMEKVTHGYLQKNIKSNDFIDFKATNEWLELRLSLHLEGYAAAIMEQEINNKESMKGKEKDPKKHQMDTKYRVCVERAIT